MTKFAAGAWVSILVMVAVVVGGSRIRRHYAIVHRALALHPVADELPRLTAAPHAGNGRPVPPPTARDTETEERPEAIRHLAIVLVRTIDVAGTRALAYVASLGQPRARRARKPHTRGGRPLLDYWKAWGDHLPLELVGSPTARSSRCSCTTSRRLTDSAPTSH